MDVKFQLIDVLMSLTVMMVMLVLLILLLVVELLDHVLILVSLVMIVMSVRMTPVINILENVAIPPKHAMIKFLVLKILAMPKKVAFIL
jgi:hypothetical protein